MTLRNCLIATIGALALGFLSLPAQSAPVGGLAGDLKIASGENSGVEKAHYRRYRYCRYHRCYRHYRHYRRHYYYGSPGIYFHFGPRWHHRRYHRRYWHW